MCESVSKRARAPVCLCFPSPRVPAGNAQNASLARAPEERKAEVGRVHAGASVSAAGVHANLALLQLDFPFSVGLPNKLIKELFHR